MGINETLHDAIILNIISYTDKTSTNIYDMVRKLISDLNWFLSPDPKEKMFLTIHETLTKHTSGTMEFFYFLSQYPHKEGNILDWLLNINTHLNQNWNNLTFFDILSYLLFIQSNCHHRGRSTSRKDPYYPKICKSPESFKDFFYISKNGLNIKKDNILITIRQKTKKYESLAKWWTNRYYEDKKNMLMYYDLASYNINPSVKTLGWTSRYNDYLPMGSIINTLREINHLPPLSGDFTLGFISGTSVENDNLHFSISLQKQKNCNNEGKNIFRSETNYLTNHNYYDFIHYSILGFTLGLFLSTIFKHDQPSIEIEEYRHQLPPMRR
tara:strand:+ start:4004 stop:4981 length:978 start_codon:yes stop_codon:yes gene_type:complete